jgi:hypothetical protein
VDRRGGERGCRPSGRRRRDRRRSAPGRRASARAPRPGSPSGS